MNSACKSQICVYASVFDLTSYTYDATFQTLKSLLSSDSIYLSLT